MGPRHLRFVAILWIVCVAFPLLTAAASTEGTLYGFCQPSDNCDGSSAAIGSAVAKETQLTCAMTCKRTSQCLAISFNDANQCTLWAGTQPTANSATSASYIQL